MKAWKTGFYSISQESGVPVALGFIDYSKKLGGIDGKLVPTGDYAADMETLVEYYTARVTKFNHPVSGEPL